MESFLRTHGHLVIITDASSFDKAQSSVSFTSFKSTPANDFILISTEPIGYRHDDHTPTAEARAAIGDQFIVDYVRVFEEV